MNGQQWLRRVHAGERGHHENTGEAETMQGPGWGSLCGQGQGTLEARHPATHRATVLVWVHGP